MLNRFIEIEKDLQNCRFELASSKNTAALMALLKAVENIGLELRNHVQGKSNIIPLSVEPPISSPIPIPVNNATTC